MLATQTGLERSDPNAGDRAGRPDQLTKHQRLVVVLTLATSRGRVDRLARFGRQRSRTIARSDRESPRRTAKASALLPTSGISPQLPPGNGRGRESGLRLQNCPADDAFAVAAAIVQFERWLHCGISGGHAQ